MDIDELMEIHYNKMGRKDEHTSVESKDEQCNMQSTEDSQECVGGKIQNSSATVSWTDIVRSDKNKPMQLSKR